MTKEFDTRNHCRFSSNVLNVRYFELYYIFSWFSAFCFRLLTMTYFINIWLFFLFFYFIIHFTLFLMFIFHSWLHYILSIPPGFITNYISYTLSNIVLHSTLYFIFTLFLTFHFHSWLYHTLSFISDTSSSFLTLLYIKLYFWHFIFISDFIKHSRLYYTINFIPDISLSFLTLSYIKHSYLTLNLHCFFLL